MGTGSKEDITMTTSIAIKEKAKSLRPAASDLQQMVDIETRNREILTTFISSHMKEGTDFGKIRIGGTLSKPSLFKAGAEKIASLMKLRADVIKDSDTWEMSGNKQGLFCYKCNLYDTKGNIVGMGLGACSLEEKKSYNNAIKIAKKRAFVDAVLTTGALSDFFTQDLEDMQQDVKVSNSTPLTVKQMGEAQEAKQIPMATPFQINKINELLEQKGKTEEPILEFYHVSELSKLNVGQANKAVEKLETYEDAPKKKTIIDEPVIDVDEVDAGIQANMLKN